jgi:hypothetical protein
MEKTRSCQWPMLRRLPFRDTAEVSIHGGHWDHRCAAEERDELPPPQVRSPRQLRLHPCCGSTLRRKNDTEQHPFIQALLPGSADMRTTIRRDQVVDLVIGNRRPFAVYLDFVMVADHAALRGQSMRLQQEPLPSFLFSFEPYATGRGRPPNILLVPAHAHSGIRIPRRLCMGSGIYPIVCPALHSRACR